MTQRILTMGLGMATIALLRLSLYVITAQFSMATFVSRRSLRNVMSPRFRIRMGTASLPFTHGVPTVPSSKMAEL